MIYLTGAIARSYLPALAAAGIGAMLTQGIGYAEDVIATLGIWAADNGCYSQGDAFNLPAYLAWLDKRKALRHLCLFATAPDVVGNAAATLKRSVPVMPLIRAAGYPVALVGQDGLENEPIPWDAFDVYFIGGSTEWKLSMQSAAIAREAVRRGKRVHQGRSNSLKRLLWAKRTGCDSADGSYLAFRQARGVPELQRWLAIVNQDCQMVLA